MVIPMPSGGGGMQGDTNLEASEVKAIKISVLVVMAGWVLELALFGGFPLNEMFFIIAGTFFLKGDENPVIKGFYDCLMKTPLGQCAGPNGGGMSCLMPIMFMGGLNLLFGLMGPKSPAKLLCELLFYFYCSFLLPIPFFSLYCLRNYVPYSHGLGRAASLLSESAPIKVMIEHLHHF